MGRENVEPFGGVGSPFVKSATTIEKGAPDGSSRTGRKPLSTLFAFPTGAISSWLDRMVFALSIR